MENKEFKKQKGFTLIELIIVMAVFMLVVAVAIAIFLSIVASQKRILQQEQMLSEVSYAMEYMSKGLRMALKDSGSTCLVWRNESGEITQEFENYIYLYTRANTDNQEYEGIKFINASNNDACQEFFVTKDATTQNNVLKELKDQTTDTYSTLLTASKYNIDYFRTSINATSGLSSYGASEDDSIQPRATLIMGFQVPGDNLQPEIKIQTTVSDRNINE